MKHYEIKCKTHAFNVEEYDSAYELVKVSSSRPVTPQWKSDCLTEVNKRFHSVASREEAYDLLKNGWTQNVDQVKMSLNAVNTANVSKRTSFRNDVVGFAPVVPLAMMNVPNSMINSSMKKVKAKVIKIYYNIVAGCSTSPETFLANGKKIMEAVMLLERSGYRCELNAMQLYTKNNLSDTLIVRVKEANQPMDVKRIMFPFTHPAFFRVIGFDWEDKCPTAQWISGRGKPFDMVVNNHLDIIREAFGNDSVYLDRTVEHKTVEEIMKTFIERR